MRKTLSKCYPRFDTTIFKPGYGSGNHWCKESEFPPIPTRFEYVHQSKSLGREKENFIAFACDVSFSDSERHTSQDGYYQYRRTVLLTDRQQLRGNLPNGDVDFFIDAPIQLANGGSLIDPSTGYGVRYPYKIATYFPIRNILLIKDITKGEPTPELKDLLTYILEKVDAVGYKFHKSKALLIGCDPEFNITDLMDERVSADSLFPDPDRNNPVGTDGSSSIGELRPAAADCPLELTANIKKLMAEVAKKIGNDKKILTGGGGRLGSTGHHIHFSKMVCSEEIELLDAFVGKPSLKIDGAKRPDSGYEATGRSAVRRQPHGCEYRTPASSLIPELAQALHVTAYCCIMKWETLQEGETFTFEIDDKTGIPSLQAYLGLDITPDKRYSPYLEEFWKWVNRLEGRKIDPKRDCLYMWVDGRKEVKPRPGIKVSWASNIFPDRNKDTFLEMEEFTKIHEISIFLLPTADDSGKNVIQVCIPPK